MTFPLFGKYQHVQFMTGISEAKKNFISASRRLSLMSCFIHQQIILMESIILMCEFPFSEKFFWKFLCLCKKMQIFQIRTVLIVKRSVGGEKIS
jgi:hypothetical protein